MSLHLSYDTINYVCFCTLKSLSTVQFFREAGQKVRGLRLENQLYEGWYRLILREGIGLVIFLPR